MTIIFATTDYIKRGQPTTGLPAYLYRVSQALISMGHVPIIVVSGKEIPYTKRDGIEIYTIFVPGRDFGNSCINYIYRSVTCSWFINKKIKEIAKNRKIDIIQFTSLHGIGMFHTGKIPAVLRLSSYAKTYFGTYATFEKKLVRIMAYIERLAAKRCNAVFAPCQITADAYGKDCHRKVYVIETPFVNDIEKCDDSLYQKELKGKKYFLFFGSLYVEKGILVIGEILEEILEKYPEYYFVFAGKPMLINGKNAAAVIRECAGKHKNRVFVLGAVPHERLYPIIENADLVLLPSLMDNFPNACVEAMYFKKIVIGTNGASFEQLIRDGYNGFLCEIGNAKDLLKKIEIAVNLDHKTKTIIGERARQRIEKLQPEYVVQKLIKLYESVIRERNNK